MTGKGDNPSDVATSQPRDEIYHLRAQLKTTDDSPNLTFKK